MIYDVTLFLDLADNFDLSVNALFLLLINLLIYVEQRTLQKQLEYIKPKRVNHTYYTQAATQKHTKNESITLQHTQHEDSIRQCENHCASVRTATA